MQLIVESTDHDSPLGLVAGVGPAAKLSSQRPQCLGVASGTLRRLTAWEKCAPSIVCTPKL
jgi:hypothetical protein